MPFNFVKQHETVAPVVEINSLVQDTSVQDAAKVLGDVASDYAKIQAEKADLASLGNFNNDLDTYQSAIDDLSDISALQKLEAINRRNKLLRDTDTSNDEAARNAFSTEIEAITLKEEQQGIVLESQRRAVVRKWSNIRPDLTPEFQKSIALNNSLYELDKVGTKTDKRFEKMLEQQQISLTTGIPIELLSRMEKTKAQAAEAMANVNFREASGKLEADSFFSAMLPTIQLHRQTLQAIVAQQVRAVQRGDPGAVDTAKRVLLEEQNKMLAALQAERMLWNSNKNHSGTVDTTRLENYIKAYSDMYIGAFSTSDALDVARAADIAKNDLADNVLADWLMKQSFGEGGFYGLDLRAAPRITNRLGTIIVEQLVKAAETGGSLERFTKEGGFVLTTEAARRGDVVSATHLRSLRALVPTLRDMSGAPNSNLTSEQVADLEVVFQALQDGRIPTPEESARSSPYLSILIRGAVSDPRTKPEERVNGENALAGDAWNSANNKYRKSNILNPQSEGVKIIRMQPAGEYESNFQQHVESKLEPILNGLGEEAGKITYSPRTSTTPFTIEWPKPYVSMNDAERRTYAQLQTATAELNKAFQIRVNTRNAGIQSGHAWAKPFYETWIKPQTPVTNNQASSGEIDLRDEDVKKFYEEEQRKNGTR